MYQYHQDHQDQVGLAVRRSGVLLVIAFLCIFFLQGCESSSDYPEPGSDCLLDEMQKYSFFEPQQVFPLKVYLDSRFKSFQRSAVTSAISEWNRFSAYSLNLKFFELVDEKIPPFDLSLYYVPQAFCAATPFVSGVYIFADYSKEHWMSMVKRENQLGVTGRCTNGYQNSKEQVQGTAAIIMNTWENSGGLFESIVLHELGHVLGLDHSCRMGSGRYGHVGCAELSRNHEFKSAVMYPEEKLYVVEENGRSTVYGDAKESLEKNDLMRAYCLYKDFRKN